MFKISLNESAALRVIANSDNRQATYFCVKHILGLDAMEIANAMINDPNSTDKSKKAAEEFLMAAKENPGW